MFQQTVNTISRVGSPGFAKAWTACIAAVLLAGPATLWAQDAGPTAPAKIVVVGEKYEFGEVWAGQKVEHTFVIKNEGGSVLKITKVKPSCGCTVAKNYDREVLPGETGKIPISINTTRLRNKITKTVTVSSNDPANGTLRLTIAGNVKQRISIDPIRGGTFGRIKPNEVVKRTLTLTNNTKNPVELQLLGAKEPGKGKFGVFIAELNEVKPGQAWELKLRTEPPYQDQYNRAQIKLKSNMPEQPVVEIAANVYALPQVEITPKDVIIPKAQDRARKQPVRVTFNTDETYKVLSAKVSNSKITASINETRPNAYTVTLDLPANYLPPTKGDVLTITTNHPKQPTVTVPIAQRRRPRARPRPIEQLAGKPVPAATFPTADGKAISTKDGQPSLYMFYASWCGYCKKAIPQLVDMYPELEKKGVRFVGVNQDTLVEFGADPNNRRSRTKEQVMQQWKDLGVNFTQAFDPDSLGRKQFKVTGFPTMFLVGKSGRVERAYSGIGPLRNGTLKKELAMLAEGKPLPPQSFAAPQMAARKRPAQTLQGKPAPKATFVTTDNKSYDAHVPGQVSFAMFYASWCPHCKKALPKIQELSQQYKDKPVRFAAISLDTLVEEGADPTKNRRAKTKEYVINQFKDYNCTFTQAFDPEKAGQTKFKVSSFPTLFLIDQKGKIDKVYVGGGAAADGTLKKDIDRLLSNGRKSADAGNQAKAELAANAK